MRCIILLSPYVKVEVVLLHVSESLQRFPCRKRMTSGEIPSLPLQSNVAVLAPFGTEQNAAFLKSMQFDMDKRMGSAFDRQVNGHVNHLPHFQSLLRQNSNSSQSVMQIDSSGAGFMPNSLQASPTSSLTSLQTSVSSLTSNSQAILSNLQNSLPPNSGNLNPLQQSLLQPLQCDQQNINNVMQHLFREMTNPKPSSGGMFHPRSGKTLSDKIELYFNDFEFSYLMLQENYLSYTASSCGLTPQTAWIYVEKRPLEARHGQLFVIQSLHTAESNEHVLWHMMLLHDRSCTD